MQVSKTWIWGLGRFLEELVLKRFKKRSLENGLNSKAT